MSGVGHWESASEEDIEDLRLHSRTPHPYHISGKNLLHAKAETAGDVSSSSGPKKVKTKHRKATSTPGSSESGTEADDETERHAFVKALPPAQLKPRKGLKLGERDEATLLTPSQLDPDGRPLEGYASQKEPLTDSEEKKLLFKRKINEFARRTSEVGLMIALGIIVLAGRGVLRTARQWWPELALQVIITVGLILAYPLRLSLIDTRNTVKKPWQRFQIPVSFDPATVLYPPFLPVLVALTVSTLNPTLILPNVILGLASLPQRLFPRSSRTGGFNSLHWLISILPLVLGSRIKWLQSMSSNNSLSLSIETLVTLYPLHHSLLAPLHYLTTSSLLISELHLLSAALINLLLFATAPQAVILKACLLIGGPCLFVLLERPLHWNVILARVPKWKLRHPGHPDAERRSLIDAVAEIVNLQRATKAFSGLTARRDSDADDDLDIRVSFRHQNGGLADGLSKAQALLDQEKPAIASADEHAIENVLPRARRSTLPATTIKPEAVVLKSKKTAKKRNSHIPWCLKLTVKQAHARKLFYAVWTYAALVLTILAPVRYYVGKRALFDQEPIGWALSYLLGQLQFVQSIVEMLGLQGWIPQPSESAFGIAPLDIKLGQLLVVAEAREIFGGSITRLLIIVYWLAALTAGLLAVFTLTPFVEVDTRRKIFHGVMVAMFMPAMFVDPCFCALAVSMVLAIFLILEVTRAAQIPPGTAIGRFIAPYVDGRDLRGPVVVSHLFLLIGCAVPLWFSLAGIGRQDDGAVWCDWETQGQVRDVGMLAGVVCVGMGDAAASLIGRRYGRRKWPWVGGKSFEGSAAFALAVTIGLTAGKLWLHIGGWQDVSPWSSNPIDILFWLTRALLSACGASFMEAVLTGANDNVVVPVALWLFVKGMRL